MYKVLAGINNVFVNEVNLNEDFHLQVPSILKKYNRRTKILFLCTPNNPVGNVLRREDVIVLLSSFPGIIVIDEAYIDFTEEESYSTLITTYPRLIVTQTLSKAWGMAGLRLGMAFAHEYIIQQLNKIKPPYNINVLTQKTVLQQLEKYAEFRANLKSIVVQRDAVAKKLNTLEIIKKIYPSEANFLLVQVPDANETYNYIVTNGVIVRNRTNQVGCENCLRLTIGTESENQRLIELLETFKAESR